MKCRFVARALLALLIVVCPALPAMAQGFGGIGGTVTDSSGAVLPGVAVSLSSSQGTVGANQQAISDERGAYQFLRLVPGQYVVKAELQGFRPAEQRGIVVNADQTSRADLKLEIGTMSEGVTVSGEAPLLDTTSALKQTVISQEVLQALPNRVDMWAITKVVPSIVPTRLTWAGPRPSLVEGAPWILTLFALGEFVTDQLPTTPSRTVPMQFAARLVTGALSGAAIGAARDNLIAGFIAGVVGAVIGTLGGRQFRGAPRTAFGKRSAGRPHRGCGRHRRRGSIARCVADDVASTPSSSAPARRARRSPAG